MCCLKFIALSHQGGYNHFIALFYCNSPPPPQRMHTAHTKAHHLLEGTTKKCSHLPTYRYAIDGGRAEPPDRKQSVLVGGARTRDGFPGEDGIVAGCVPILIDVHQIAAMEKARVKRERERGNEGKL